MSHTKKPDITGCITLGQLNHAIRPLKITSEGLAAFGFEPKVTYMSAKYYRAEDLPEICRTLALGVLWPEGEALLKTKTDAP
jgi:hypothetical protein